jgi:hypothetical protein
MAVFAELTETLPLVPLTWEVAVLPTTTVTADGLSVRAQAAGAAIMLRNRVIRAMILPRTLTSMALMISPDTN